MTPASRYFFWLFGVTSGNFWRFGVPAGHILAFWRAAFPVFSGIGIFSKTPILPKPTETTETTEKRSYGKNSTGTKTSRYEYASAAAAA